MQQMRSLLAAPTFTDDELRTRNARLMHALLWSGLIALFGTALFALFIAKASNILVALVLLALLGMFSLLLLLRSGRVRWTGLLLIIYVNTLILAWSLISTRPFGVAAIGCVLIIFYAGILFELRGVAFACLSGIVVVTATAWAWSLRLASADAGQSIWLDWLGYVATFIISGGLALVTTRIIRGTFWRLKQSEDALAVKNQSLLNEIEVRREAEARHSAMTRMMREVLQCANQLLTCKTQDEIWMCAVELARERLGVERCAIFLCENSAEGIRLRGTYGTNLKGQTTDERAITDLSAPVEEPHLTLQSAPPAADWSVAHNVDLYEWNGTEFVPVGKGWCAKTSIQSQHTATHAPIGIFFNDSARSGASFDPIKQELISVYCSLLGSIAERKRLEIELQERAKETATTAERSRLARDLHDSVSQALFGIALGARTATEMLQTTPEKASMPISYIEQLSEGALSEMRALIFALRPESLQTEGLILALDRQATMLGKRHQVEVVTDLGSYEPPLDITAKEALYRIGMEAMQNTIKHAQATVVHLKLSVANHMVTLEVSDNGIGFDDTITPADHYGLHTMRERAAMYGGHTYITSRPGHGTTVRVHIPIDANANDNATTASSTSPTSSAQSALSMAQPASLNGNGNGNGKSHGTYAARTTAR